MLSGCGGSSGEDEGSGNTAPPLAENIATAIVGAWQAACQAIPESNTSERTILAFDGTIAARDSYEYDGVECSGVPRGQSFPLRLYS